MAEPGERGYEREILRASLEGWRKWINEYKEKATFLEARKTLNGIINDFNEAVNQFNKGDDKKTSELLEKLKEEGNNFLVILRTTSESVWNEIVSLSNEIRNLNVFRLPEDQRKKLLDASSKIEIATENLSKNDIDGAIGPLNKAKELAAEVIGSVPEKFLSSFKKAHPSAPVILTPPLQSVETPKIPILARKPAPEIGLYIPPKREVKTELASEKLRKEERKKRRAEEEERIQRLLERGFEIPRRELVQGKLVPELIRVPEGGPKIKPREIPSKIATKERRNKVVNETSNLIDRFNSLTKEYKTFPQQFYPAAKTQLEEARRLLEENKEILSTSIPTPKEIEKGENNNKRIREILDGIQRTSIGTQVKGRDIQRARLLGGQIQPPKKEKEPIKEVEVAGEVEAKPEEREPDTGIIKGRVIDKETKKAPTEVVYIQADSPYITRPFNIPANEDGTYQITVPVRPGGIEYSVTATADFYKKPRPQVKNVSPDHPVEVNFELEPDPRARIRKEREKEEEEKKWKEEEKEYRKKKKGWLKSAPVLDKDWWTGPNTIFRLILAFLITLAVNFWLYQPSISATGIERNVIMVWLLPFLFLFILFFSLPKKLEDLSDWGPLILGAVAGIGTWVGFQFFVDMELAPFIKFGIPLIVYFVVWYFARKNVKEKKGIWPTLAGLTGLLALIGIGVFLFTLIQSGGLTNMETYLKPLNILHLIGVPQDTIDNMKDGIRNVLSFLQFKAVEPVKPEAKKIGGFEAIQLKFGSKYNNYLLPTLFAKMDYSLPVSIINPNSLTSPIPADKLTIRNFYITDVFLNNRSDNRIMCGKITECTIKSGCEITPESEKTLTLEFKNSENCLKIVKEYRSSAEEPLYPVKTLKYVDDLNGKIDACKKSCDKITDESAKTTCKNQCPETVCSSECTNLGWNKLTLNFKKAAPTGDECRCEFKREQNIMDELCFMNNDKATIELKSNYNFSVEGKGELIIVQKETDKKLAPKPSITSSAGPITITTYFVPDIVVLDKEVKTAKMFVQISNDGDGTATINLPGKKPDLQSTDNKLQIGSCIPAANEIFVGEEDSTIVCDATAPSSISGNYLTSPVIVNINYTYSQEHSITLNVKKAYIPEGVDDNRAKELYGQISSLPYYCHRDISGGVDTALDIYKQLPTDTISP